MTRLSGAVSSARAHALCLFAATLLVLVAYDLRETPLVGDRALFVYLGQTVLRGESVYATSLFNYLPLGPLVTGGAMWLGERVGVPTYLAPRYLAAAVVASSVVLTYSCTRRATGRAWPGILAGLVLCGISILARFSVAGLEPKVLVLLLGLVACHCLQRRWFLGLGVACGLGATCWQPFALVAGAYTLQTVWAGRRALLPSMGRFLLGALLGLLPVAIYLTLTEGWLACWRITFVMLSRARMAGEAERPLLWLTWLLRLNEAVLVATAGLGILGFAARALRGGPGHALRAVLHPRMGGIPLATLAWAVWNTYSFDGIADTLPFLYLLGFWNGWLAFALVAWTAAWVPSGARRHLPRALAAAALLATALYGLADVPAHATETTLSQQAAMARWIRQQAGPGATLACIAAEEFYLFDESKAPYPFLRLKVGQRELGDDMIRMTTGLEGCAGILELTRSLLPVALVLSERDSRNHTCVNRIADVLLRRGYRRGQLAIDEPVLTEFGERGGGRSKVFFVYLPPRGRAPSDASQQGADGR